MVSTQQLSRKCVSCGRPLEWNASLCPYCGHDYRPQAQIRQPQRKSSSGWIVAVVVIVVVVVFVLPFVMYMMILGFGGTDGGTTLTPATNVLAKSNIQDGVRVSFLTPTMTVSWSQVMFQLSDGFNTAVWLNCSSAALTGPAPEEWHYGTGQYLGSFEVFANVTDLEGDGVMGMGDSIALTTGGGAFASGSTYTLILLYVPTGESMLAYPFTI